MWGSLANLAEQAGSLAKQAGIDSQLVRSSDRSDTSGPVPCFCFGSMIIRASSVPGVSSTAQDWTPCPHCPSASLQRLLAHPC